MDETEEDLKLCYEGFNQCCDCFRLVVKPSLSKTTGVLSCPSCGSHKVRYHKAILSRPPKHTVIEELVYNI